MKFVPEQIRQQCLQTIEGVEQSLGARIVHAEIIPSSGYGMEGRGEDYMLRLAFLRRPEVYLEIGSETQVKDAYRREPNSPIAIMAMDLKDSLSMVHDSAEMAAAAVAPYMGRWTGEMLVRNSFMESMAPQYAALGAAERSKLDLILSQFVSEGVRFVDGGMPPVSQQTPAPQPQPAGFSFGFTAPNAPETPHEQARGRSLVGRAFVALAMKAQLASGSLPAVDALDWPQPMLAAGFPSLKVLLNNTTQYRGSLKNASEATNNFVAANRPAGHVANSDLSSVFGVRNDGAPAAAQANPRAQFRAELSRSVANMIQNLEGASIRSGGIQHLATQTLSDSGLIPADEAPAAAPIADWGSQQQPAAPSTQIAQPSPIPQAFV